MISSRFIRPGSGEFLPNARAAGASAEASANAAPPVRKLRFDALVAEKSGMIELVNWGMAAGSGPLAQLRQKGRVQDLGQDRLVQQLAPGAVDAGDGLEIIVAGQHHARNAGAKALLQPVEG